MHKGAKCYGLYDEENIIGFIAILHQPNAKNKKLKRVTRLVILPDYQGIGLGIKFLTFIAKLYYKNGFDFHIKTSAKNIIMSLKKSKNWIFYSYGFSDFNKGLQSLNKTTRNQSKTATFFYGGE